jgi:hypothetical protein
MAELSSDRNEYVDRGDAEDAETVEGSLFVSASSASPR